MTRAVIYARYSSEKQTEQSIEGQLAVCYEYAQRQGYTVTAEYTDRARSAKTDARPGFQQMIADSAKGLFEVVLVYQLDRFARNRYDSAIYKAKLKKSGVRVLSARENITDDASGVLMEAVLEGMAEYFSAELSQKVKRGMGINAEKCLSNGGTIPFGFKIDADRHFVVDEDKAPYLRQIFEMYADGHTGKEIADYLNAKQIRTASGSRFNKSSFHRLLTNKRYIGVYTYNGLEIPDGIPRLIPDELFYRVAEKMEQNKTAPARARAKEEYLLTTKLFCGHCREMMVGVSGTSSTGKKHAYYSCNKRLKKLCDKKNVSKDWIEDKVYELALAQLDDESIARIAASVVEICEKERTQGDYRRLEKLRKENEKQTANLVDALKHGQATKTLLAEISKLEADHEDIERQLIIEKAKNLDLTIEHVTFFLTKLRQGDLSREDHRRILINVLVNAVYLYDDRLTVVFNTSDRPVDVPDGLQDDMELADVLIDSPMGHHSLSKANSGSDHGCRSFPFCPKLVAPRQMSRISRRPCS